MSNFCTLSSPPCYFYLFPCLLLLGWLISAYSIILFPAFVLFQVYILEYIIKIIKNNYTLLYALIRCYTGLIFQYARVAYNTTLNVTYMYPSVITGHSSYIQESIYLSLLVSRIATFKPYSINSIDLLMFPPS
jgi:hypothetical protein